MIRVSGDQLLDQHGRTVLLRGVNLGGSSKQPARPGGDSWSPAGFFEHRNVSFADRPFPLTEADEHFERLQRWGFTFLRFLVTWEAIEHAGPGIYDQEYLDYVEQIIHKAGEHGFELFVDPHQDVWSRFSGGDGAPGWTLEAAGLDMTRFRQTGAAIVHASHGDPFPRMIWPTNYGKLANLTMWTLFFGGNDFAPDLRVDGTPIQDFLQSHYIEAVRQVALRVKGLPCVAGFDTLNEPHNGMIGMPDVRGKAGPLQMGDSPTALQAMLLGAGYAQTVDICYAGILGRWTTGRKRIDPDGIRCYLPDVEPIWKRHGVWSLDSRGRPHLLRPDFFARVNGQPVDFNRDYFKPFVHRFSRAIRSVLPEAILFVEGVPDTACPEWKPDDPQNIVHAPHWYDAVTLITKRHNGWLGFDPRHERIVFGREAVRRSFRGQFGEIAEDSRRRMGGVPTLIGETGTPFDLDAKRAYRTGDFRPQEAALDATLQALDATLISATLWNYTPDNSNARGDLWNDEDFSIYSPDQKAGSQGEYAGGRALRAAVRPYARRVAGTPLRQSFDYRTGEYVFAYRSDPEIEAPTEIFIPRLQFPSGVQVEASSGRMEWKEQEQVLLHFADGASSTHHIQLRRNHA